MSGLLKVLVNVVFCSALPCGKLSTLFVPKADKSSIDLKRWYQVSMQETLS